jgi:hypothetical protein
MTYLASLMRYRLWWGLGLALLLSVVSAGWSSTAALIADNPTRLEILVRTADGAPVPSVQVMLRPASYDLGGPATPVPTQQATTDTTGRASFADLDHWVWYATFAGSVAGQPLQAQSEQGQPPWGTNPAGNGFPLVVDPQLENASNLSPITSTEQLLVTYPFVLVRTGSTWAPALDLMSDTASPLPLPTAEHLLPTPAPSDAAIIAPPARGAGSTGLLLLLVVALLGGFALYKSWRQRIRAMQGVAGPDDADKDADDPEAPLAQPPGQGA